MSRLDLRFLLVLACFAVSGFAGLLYQTSWTREFSFVFGTSGLAVATVLAAYMAGLALGASLAGRFIDRVTRPVLVYGVLELGIALSALAVPSAIESARGLHVALLSGTSDPGTGLPLALYLCTSFAILCIPTAFMGATLPLLARHAVRADDEIGPRIGALYAINTAGAIAGTLATAFWLMPELGLRGTIRVGALLNGLVFVGAALLARGTTGPVVNPVSADASVPLARTARIVLVLSLVAGVASFSYEVLWTRLLEHVMGGSVYAFASMLASFLLGIALGGGIAARFATSRQASLRGLALTQLGAAALSLVAYAGIGRIPLWVGDGIFGSHIDTLRLAGVAAALLLPSTLCIGAMFPFAVRALAENASAAAQTSARVYSWNTAGAIVGSLGAGFFVLPWLGFAGSLTATLLLNVAVAAAAWSLTRPRGPMLAAGMAAVVGFVLVSPPATPWRLLRSEPLRVSENPPSDDSGVVFHAVGRSASVLAVREGGGVRLRSNGVPEAVIPLRGARPGGAATARWLGALPAFAPNGAKRMLVIGLGGGVAVETVPPNVEQIEVVELEPEIVAANRFVGDRRQHDPLRDPRVRVRVGDARSVLELTPEPYDAIVSQPSHPWTAGASHLYTRDFFKRVRAGLSQDGIFVQWLGLGFVDEPLLQSFVATLLDVFPQVRLYRPHPNGALFVASTGSLDLEAQVPAVVKRDPALLASLGVRVPEDLMAALSFDTQGARRFAGDAPVITDDHNLMATRAPRVLLALVGREDEVLAPYDALLGGRPGMDADYLVQRLCAMRRRARAERVAASLPTERGRKLGAATVAIARRQRDQAARALSELVEADPNDATARFRLAELLQRFIAAGDPRVRDLVAGLRGEAAQVAEGWKLVQAGRWQALARLDDALSGVPPGAPHYGAAEQLRIAWRVELGREDRALAASALALIDAEAWGWGSGRIAQRALAAAYSGQVDAALASVRELAAMPPKSVGAAIAGQGLRALAALPRDTLGTVDRQYLVRELEARRATAAAGSAP